MYFGSLIANYSGSEGAMGIFHLLLVLSTLSCTLVTGFVLTFSIVVIPGFSKLNDRDFIRSFQVTDGVIQRRQPIFLFVWLSSFLSVFSLMLWALTNNEFAEVWLVLVSGALYLLGVQGLTVTVHLPLNRRMQKLNVIELDPQTLHTERVYFEARWNFYNNVRTLLAFLSSITLLGVTALH